MNISFDCSEVIAEVNQRCTLEGRQPTVEEYDFVIDCLRQANTQLLQMNERLSHDREISQKLFHTEHLEVGRDNIRLHSLVKWFLYDVLITSPNFLPPEYCTIH